MITDSIELEREVVARKAREMSHWVKLAKDLYASKDEAYILTMLKVELLTLRRDYVIQRIFAHFTSTRRRREIDEIKAWRSNNRTSRKQVEDETFADS